MGKVPLAGIGIGLQSGPAGVRVLMSEVLLYTQPHKKALPPCILQWRHLCHKKAPPPRTLSYKSASAQDSRVGPYGVPKGVGTLSYERGTPVPK